jgi:hypothetical protein
MPVKPNLSSGSVSYLIGLAQDNVNVTACRFPPWNVAGAEILISVSEAPVVFGAVHILVATSFRVARPPELLDETFAFGIRYEQ